MGLGIFSCQKQFKSRLSYDNTVKHICENLNNQYSNVIINNDDNNMQVTIPYDGILFHNSFLPQVLISILSNNGEIDVYVQFSLRKSINILISFYFVLATLISIVVALLNLPMVFMPLTMIIVAALFCVFCLRLSSKKIFDIICDNIAY